MNRILLFTLTTIFFLLPFLGYAQNCEALFTFDDTDLTIQFTDASIVDQGDQIVTWFWDFDDGNTSSLPNPQHTFPDADKYKVTLTITTANGCSSEIEVVIEICEFALSISVDPACDANNEVTVQFTVNDLYDNADEIDILLDGVLLAGSPFEIDQNNPVQLNIQVAGDGLSHTLQVQSLDIGTCNESVSFTVPDCTSNCFLSSMAISVQGGMTHQVDVGDNFFTPEIQTITLGDIVDFVWIGDGHTTTSDVTSGPDSWNSGELGFGASYPVTIQNPGSHPYYCIPHGGPGGVGMSGTIVANCPPNDEFQLLISFNTTIADPAGFNLLIDGILQPGSPFPYNGTGPQSVSTTQAGDGQPHTVEIEDVADPTCILSQVWNAPDCGAAPTCQLTLALQENGPCDANDNVPVELTVTAINPGTGGFEAFVDGVSAGIFPYNSSGPTVIQVDVPGNGQNHTISVEDVDDPTCSASDDISTTDCALPCSLSGLNASTGNPVTHVVLVEDFDFTPADITIADGDQVQWQWTGVVPHTSTSDATAGPDVWDSGLLGQGAFFLSPVLSAGLHQYYCIPHGGPGGVGMSGSITVQANCTNGMVPVSVSFNEQGGGFSGFQVLVDGVSAGTFPYDPSGSNTFSVDVAGDGQSHTISVEDIDDPSCNASTTLVTPDCNAPTCQLTLALQENGPCDANDNVPVELTVTQTGGGTGGFEAFVDGVSAGIFPYNSSGPTVVQVNVPGNGQSHTISVEDVDDPTCSASDDISTTDCALPCSLSGLSLEVSGSGSGITHTIEVRDFDFLPPSLSINSGDIVQFSWVGVIPHTTTSDATSGADVWDSGLLGQGSTFDLELVNEGIHPYYCIPHGAPGGVGMAGIINVGPPTPSCVDGMVTILIAFTQQNPGTNGFSILVDGSPYPGGPFQYGSGMTQVSIMVLGDGATHDILIRDVDSPQCSINGSLIVPDCNTSSIQCEVQISEIQISDCDSNNLVQADLAVVHTVPAASGFYVFLNGNLDPQSPYPYMGDTTNINFSLDGNGGDVFLEVVDIDSVLCRDSITVSLPLCGAPCTITNIQSSTDQPFKHIVEVRDFDFFPQNLDILIGDTVSFMWTGSVPHTSTSDVFSGPNSWDSGLLGQGSEYTIVLTEVGEFPYYCIPHGGPGGIGMAGTISVEDTCENGIGSVWLSFQAEEGSASGYRIFLDGDTLAGPFLYQNQNGANSILITLDGDGMNHIVTLQDVEVPFCAASHSIQAPICPQDCEISQMELLTGDQITHEVFVEDFYFAPQALEATVGETVRFLFTGQIPHTTTSDAISGPDSWDSGLLGQGSSFDVVLQNPGVHPYYCAPHGGPGGIGMAGSLFANEACSGDSVDVEIRFQNSGGSMSGFRVFIDGLLIADSIPYNSPSGLQSYTTRLPGDGGVHLITVQDLGTGFCASTQSIEVANCLADCQLDNLTIKVPEPVLHQVEVRDFEFFPKELSVLVGDTVLFVWTGVIPHTTTSDASSGSGSWDSGLFGQGATFQVLINEAGEFPYYCIPHGAPGGIGMAGVITAEDPCQGDSIVIQANFEATSPGQEGYVVFLDGEALPDNPQDYQPGLFQSFEFTVAGDGQQHSIFISDAETPTCFVDTAFFTPQCDTSCGQLIAAFSYQLSGDLTLDFSDESIGNPDTWSWDFGDGSQINTAQSPTHSFDSTGIYTICLTISENGCSADTCMLIDLSDPCLTLQPDFQVFLDGLSAEFTDLTTGQPDNWLWGFGDGTTSTFQNPEHTYTSDGQYTVCLQVQRSSENCIRSACRQISIEVTSTSNIEAPERTLTISPNPSTTNQSAWAIRGILPLDYGNTLKLSIFDTRGVHLLEENVTGRKTMIIENNRNIPAGFYIVRLYAGSHAYIGRLIVQ